MRARPESSSRQQSTWNCQRNYEQQCSAFAQGILFRIAHMRFRSRSHFDGSGRQAAFFLGTLAPFLRASERPIAIACFRLVTLPPLPPLPDRRVPRFSRRNALPTALPAASPYLRRLAFFFAGIPTS